MKGLPSPPSLNDFKRAYELLQSRLLGRGSPIDLDEVILLAAWSRFDPRLGEQLVEVLARDWKELSGIQLQEKNSTSVWPAALAVVLEFVEFIMERTPVKDLSLFRRWKDLVLDGVRPAHHEQFFIGLAKIAGKQMQRDAKQSLVFYRRWGYLAYDWMVSKTHLRPTTVLTHPQRMETLRSLVKTRSRLTVSDYIQALGDRVSRRQAERDLEAMPALRPLGKTRGRIYVRK